MTLKEKACLICLDGWGISLKEDSTGDAIRNAETPVMDKLKREYPYTTLEAHGLAVGLPEGLMGNSEVGHLNIGAGRVVYQVYYITILMPILNKLQLTCLNFLCITGYCKN